MVDVKKAKLAQRDGEQVVVLPVEYRFAGDEVFVTRDDATGNVMLMQQPGTTVWQDMFDYMDSLEIPQEDLDEYMAERPMNLVVFRPSVFEDEE